MRSDRTEPERTRAAASTDGWSRDGEAERRRAELIDEPADRGARHDGSRALERQVTTGGAPGVWQGIKSRFVDDPAGAVAAAEELVNQVVEERIRALRDEAAGVCARDGDGDGEGEASSTEVLRSRLLRCQMYYEQLAGIAVHPLEPDTMTHPANRS